MAPRKVVRKAAVKRKAAVRPAARLTRGTSKHAATSASPVKRSPPSGLQGVSAHVINLDRRPDRWATISRGLSKQAPWLKASRLSAVDGKASPPTAKEVSQKWKTNALAELFHWYKAVTIQMSPGERGCCGSHIKAWRLAAKCRAPTIVLEDDAVCLPTFTSTVSQAVKEAPKGTDMVWLSSKDRGYPKKVGKVLMKPDFVWTTVGYIIWPAAAKRLLKLLPMDMPVDNWLGLLIKAGDVNAYSVKPAAVRQAQTWNVGSDVPHSDDVAH